MIPSFTGAFTGLLLLANERKPEAAGTASPGTANTAGVADQAPTSGAVGNVSTRSDASTPAAPAATPSPAFKLLPVADENPILIEGSLIGRELSVTLPNGEIWKYSFAVAEPMQMERVLMVLVDRTNPRMAACFQPSISGTHPFVGVANRFGVEGGTGA